MQVKSNLAYAFPEAPDAFDLDTVIDWIKAQNYRVTRPFVPRATYCEAKPPVNLLRAAIVDVETTGISHANDKIIELGIVIVEYSPETGQAYRVLETYNELEDPGMPIPEDSTRVHGITDDMVKGKRIFDAVVAKMLEEVELVVAHNAGFDRMFLESRLPFFKERAWACSYAQLPWKNAGFNAFSLEFLAYKFGFHFHGHRASIDCHALLEILQSEWPASEEAGEGRVFKDLLERAHTQDLKISALHTPFENKDKLKGRGYRWDAERKTWYTTVSEADLAKEANWLRLEVYNDSPFKLEQETIDAYNRFSKRRGVVEVVGY